MKRIFLSIAMCVMAVVLKAQMGYQVALLNSATGEPRANVTVTAAVSITDSEGATVYTETQTATTNDFGILSLSVGYADTFKEADWNKLPFFISVSVDGVLVGKSQILSVPVAEYAKMAGNVLTKEMLVGTWTWQEIYDVNELGDTRLTFNSDGSGIYTSIIHFTDGSYSWNRIGYFHYEILSGGKIGFVNVDKNIQDALLSYPVWYSFSSGALIAGYQAKVCHRV